MPFALNLYHDQIDASGSTASALPAAHRLLYVRHGRAVINGQSLNSDQAGFSSPDGRRIFASIPPFDHWSRTNMML